MKEYNCPLWEKTLSEALRPMDIEYLRANMKELVDGKIDVLMLAGGGHGKSLVEKTLSRAFDNIKFEKSIVTVNCWKTAWMHVSPPSCPSVFFNNRIRPENMISDLNEKLKLELPEIRKWVLL